MVSILFDDSLTHASFKTVATYHGYQKLLFVLGCAAVLQLVAPQPHRAF